MRAAEVPRAVAHREGGDVGVVEAREHAFALSRTAARKLFQQGAVSVSGDNLAAGTQVVDAAGAVHGRWFLLRKGGRDVAVVELV